MGSCKSHQLVTTATFIKTPGSGALFEPRPPRTFHGEPKTSAYSKKVKLHGTTYLVSCCTIPGTLHCPSKDTWFYESNGESLLLGVYDGHGKEAVSIIDYCRSFAIDFYAAEAPIMQPCDFLVKLNKAADTSLMNEASIDTTYSGTSQTVLLLMGQTAYVSNIGDSKCCLGSRYGDPNEQDYSEEPMPKLVRRISAKRSLPATGIVPTLLTTRHVPTNDDECTRIIRHNGRVQQLARDGKRLGPYRVWEPLVDMPGLTITRTMGDSSLKDLGVTAIPSISRHPVNSQSDDFIVLGTEGLWSVLSAKEAVDFIETHREQENLDKEEQPNLAQLLCEEARTRWNELVKVEKVPCDDVTCIVVELNQERRSGLHRFIASREPPVTKVKILPVHMKATPIDLSTVSIPDPRRSPCVESRLAV